MSKTAIKFFACIVAVSFVAAPLAAMARINDKANSGICKSGKRAGDIKNCKENGGKR
jgi:hypothetical protein